MLLSICAIIPTYNRAALLRETIDSVLAQSYPLAQIIVVSDGSTDNTSEIVRRYGDKVTLLEKTNGGKSSALNLGLSSATADCIWICDDDDLAAKDGLYHLAKALENDSEAGLAFGTFQIFREEKGKRIFSPPSFTFRSNEPDWTINFLEQMFTFQFAMLVRRSVYQKVGPFREDLIRSQDYEMTLRLVTQARAVYVPEIIFFQRAHQGQRGSASVKFTAAENERRWLEYDWKIFETILREKPLAEFIPSFARSWPEPLRSRAALCERACIAARRALWKEVLTSLHKANALHSGAASLEETTLAEFLTTTPAPWDVLANQPGLLHEFRQAAQQSTFIHSMLQAMSRALVWQTRHHVQRRQWGSAFQRVKLMHALLGVKGMTQRLIGSLRA